MSQSLARPSDSHRKGQNVEVVSRLRGRAVQRTPHESDRSLTCCVNSVQKVDVAQRVDELTSPVYKYTAAPPEEQNDRGSNSSFISAKRLQR
jgi:hypothetical protein